MKKYTKTPNVRKRTQIRRNTSIIGDSIEVMVERLMQGEGVDGVEDRDLVYNDGETAEVNPITNIRSDKFELMLNEKIGEYEYRRNKMKIVPKDDDKTIEDQDATGTEN